MWPAKTRWFYAYVAGIKSPPSLRAIRGIAVHAAVEVDMAQKIESKVDIPASDMLDAYDTSWGRETADGFAVDEDEDPGVIKDKGYELVTLYRERVAPAIQPIEVELPIQFTINGQIYTGQIDLTEEVEVPGEWGPDRKHIIRDTKTTGRTPANNSYLLNMTGYAIGRRQMTGDIESDTALDYLIALKSPTYKEIRMGGPVTDEQISQFAGIVGDVSGAIQAGRFVANGLVSGACSWCGYRDICPAYLKQDPNK